MKRLLLTALLMLTACATPPPTPTDHFYRLPAAQPGDCDAQVSGVLRLEPFRSTGLLRGRSIVYAESSSNVELDSYDYHLWQDSPAYLIRDHLARYLDACNFADKVTTAAAVPAEWVLQGTIHDLMHVRGRQEISIVLELQLRQRGQAAPVVLKTYREHKAVAADGMPAVVAAFGRALNRIYQRFLTDFGQRSER